ncbi:MAG TPA: sugar nucleotide-binding protein [Luteimonas sp.]|nr:sugar nucleotide-binding protein [Luteimonas sp.]
MTKTSRRILLLGGSGFLGREIARRLRDQHQLRATHCTSAADSASIRFDIFKDPPELLGVREGDLVICSARLFDANLDAGAEAAQRVRAFQRLLRSLARNRLLLLSTDAVFSGRAGQYTEKAEREPLTAYGRRMSLYEDLLRAELPDHCIVRASYLYGYSAGQLDKRLADSQQKLERGERLEFYDDMYKSPLEVAQAAEAVSALALSDFVGTVHAGGPRMSVYQFQREALAALGMATTNVHPVAMPHEPTLTRDTSLNSALMIRMTRVVPRSVAAALAGSE